MTKRKSIIATSVLAFVMCLTLVLGVSLGATTFVAHAEESKNMPQIVSVVDKKGNVTEVDEDMVNLPVGIVGDEYYAKIVTANENDIVNIKPYAEGTRGCLPKGLVFNAKTKEITGTPAESEAGVSRDVQIYCDNEYGSTNIRGWLNVFSADQKPTLTGEVPTTAYVGSLYSAMVEVGGYNQYFTVTLEGTEGVDYPQGMTAYRSGNSAYVQFMPTSDMKTTTPYEFTLCVDNGLGVVKKECTITVASGVVPPEIITPKQPLGYSEDNPNGKRAMVGEPYEFWLQASGTDTPENPLTFFAYDETTPEKATPNGKGEYDLGNGLFLTKDGKIYSDCVLEYEGQENGSIRQKTFYIGASNKNAYGNEQDSGRGSGYCFLKIVKGYMIDSFTISPQKTDIPRGGQRQFTAHIEGIGDFDKTVIWELIGYPTDENTKIDRNSGLLTIGANETSTDLKVIGYLNGGKQSIPTDPINIIDHIHSTHLVEAVARTCETDGNFEYFKCDSCGGMFSDAKAINTLTEEQVVIKKGHEYGNLTPEVPATCSATGTEAYYECGVCHKLFDESKNEKTAEQLVIAIDSSAHNYGSMIDEVPATCASEGTKAHKDCLLCGKHFDNANNEITDLSLAKNDSHDLETVWTKAADGHYHKCKREGCKDNGKVDFAAHTPDRSEATEENAVKCTVCDYIITPALGHTHHLTLVSGKAATCQADGKKAYYTCDGCSEKFEDEAGTIAITADIDTWGIIPKAHKFGEWIAEVPATKEATGTKAHKDCEFCGKHFDKDGNEIADLTIAKLPADSGENPPSGGDDKPNGGDDKPNGGDGKPSGVDDQPSGGNSSEETPQPAKKGLSGGAIAGIAIGSVAVAGLGGFSLVWFVIKKKTFAELIVAIKGVFGK